MSRSRAVYVASSMLLLGCHVGGGPVFAYAPGHGGAGVGWELGGGYGPLRGSAGQVYRPAGADADARTFHLAFELGIAGPLTDEDAPIAASGGAMFGTAEDGSRRDHTLFGFYGGALSPLTKCGDPVIWSAVLGMRFFGDTFELFATPKANLAACILFLPVAEST